MARLGGAVGAGKRALKRRDAEVQREETQRGGRENVVHHGRARKDTEGEEGFAGCVLGLMAGLGGAVGAGKRALKRRDAEAQMEETQRGGKENVVHHGRARKDTEGGVNGKGLLLLWV